MSPTENAPSVLDSEPGLFTVPDAPLRAEITAHTPLLFDELTHEPYLPLNAPFDRFKLTPQRYSDRESIVEMMNDPKVVRTIVGPPFPFPYEEVDSWFKNERKLTKGIFEAFAKGEWRPVKGSPLICLRENIEGGEDKLVGQVDLRHGFWWKERITPLKEHWEEWREKEKIYSMGACFKSEYYGQGIGSAATEVLFNKWAVPQIGATEIRAECFLTNIPSNRLWEKLGFKDTRDRREIRIPKERTGGEEQVETERVLVWTLP